MSSHIIFNSTKKSAIQDWSILDDIVMGGKSASTFKINANGCGVFKGIISLENNGGFSSVRYKPQKIHVKKYTKVILKLQGDGKNYQFRIKANSQNSHSFVAPFSTSGEWQQIEIPLKEMYPSLRGRKLDKPNFEDEYIETVIFLIGNKTTEHFKLLIEKIELK
ncbi:MAG: CIA30 family protein [Vicingaceae bacterium]|jgi:NADH dehydrogenase [ubiquinone] 1 alpha subcomplex assembly factor 1